MLEEREGKNKFWKGVVTGALVTALFALLAICIGAVVWMMGTSAKENGGEKGADSGQTAKGEERKLDMDRIGPKLQYMQQLVDTYFLYQDEEDYMEDAEEWIYTGFIASLGDPYAAYYSAEDYQSVQDDTSGEYCGIGVLVSQNMYTGIITASKVFKGSPAEEAGMLPGDIFYKVGDLEVSGMDLSLLVSDHIKGEEGTEVTITVFRESVNDYVELTMERRMVEHPTVEYAMLEDQVGYILLSSFEEVSEEQFKLAYDDLESKGMEKLVIDLRNNGGGVVDSAEGIADYLLPDGKEIVTFKGKNVPDSVKIAQDEHETKLPVAILVNEHSASASEVVTGALKDNDMAIVVGEKTFGKGIAQGIFGLADGSALKLTTSYYYTPSGECIHEIGIEPDVPVELLEELKSLVEIPKEEDNQLKAAVDALERGVDAVNEELEALAEEAEEELVFPEMEE